MQVGHLLPSEWRNAPPFNQFAEHWFVIYFYPKDNTPGCTQEAQEFRDLHADFLAAKAQIVGVSRDSEKSHAGFCEKHQLAFPLIADTEEKFCRLFDVLRPKKNFGREYVGIERSTFLIDPQGRLCAEWRGVKVAGHALAVLNELTRRRK